MCVDTQQCEQRINTSVQVYNMGQRNRKWVVIRTKHDDWLNIQGIVVNDAVAHTLNTQLTHWTEVSLILFMPMIRVHNQPLASSTH